MKIIKTLVYALALCLSLVSVAEAKMKGRSGASFKGGFSSQRQKAPKPAVSYQTPPAASAQQTKPSFGGFGKSSNTQATNQPSYQQSQMSRDLGSSNAQANAQRTWDTRNNSTRPQAAEGAAAGKSESGWFRTGNTDVPNAAARAPSNYSQAGAGNQPRQTGQYRSERRGGDNGGFWHGLMWFMLGQSLANSAHANNAHNSAAHANPAAPATVPPVDGSMNLGPADAVPANTSASVIEQPAPANDVIPAAEPESAFVSLLRAFLWTLVVVTVFWLARGFIRMRNRLQRRRSNYSLGN